MFIKTTWTKQKKNHVRYKREFVITEFVITEFVITEFDCSNNFVNQLFSTLGNVNKKGYDPVPNKWQRKVGMNRKKTFSTFLSQFHRWRCWKVFCTALQVLSFCYFRCFCVKMTQDEITQSFLPIPFFTKSIFCYLKIFLYCNLFH